MAEKNLTYLGKCIREARIAKGLTQLKLSAETGVSVKAIQNIEKGTMNPSYEILYPIVKCLKISGSTLFNPEITEQDERLQQFIIEFQLCSPKNQKFILEILYKLSHHLNSLD